MAFDLTILASQVVHDFFEFKAVELRLLAIGWMCEVPCVAHSAQSSFEGRWPRKHFFERKRCHMLLCSSSHRINRTWCVLDFNDFILLADIDWSKDLLQRFKLVISATSHVRFAWRLVSISLLVSAIQQWGQHYEHWVELGDSKYLRFYDRIILWIYEKGEPLFFVLDSYLSLSNHQ